MTKCEVTVEAVVDIPSISAKMILACSCGQLSSLPVQPAVAPLTAARHIGLIPDGARLTDRDHVFLGVMVNHVLDVIHDAAIRQQQPGDEFTVTDDAHIFFATSTIAFGSTKVSLCRCPCGEVTLLTF